MLMDEELPHRVCQTTGGTKSMLTIFFNPKEFAIVNLLPQDTSFTAAYFVESVSIPLADRHAQQVGEISRLKLHLHFDNSKCHTARYVQEKKASHRCVHVPHPPYSPDLAIADVHLFGRFEQQLSGTTLNSEENVLETVTEIRSELPNSEVKSAFRHWKERYHWVADHNGELYPN
jgi:histone-lysine N-methyltransferase SETMAR